MDCSPVCVETHRVRLDLISVSPGAANLVAMFEDHNAVALTADLSGSYKARGTGADHRNVAICEWMESGRYWHVHGHVKVLHCCYWHSLLFWSFNF